MSTVIPETKNFQVADFKSDVHNDWCPGCGDFGVVSAVQMALAKLQVPPHRVAVISGIGCAGKTAHYMQAYSFHTLHGRVMPSVTAMKLANRLSEAMTAEPMAIPLVSALVVLPTASRSARIFRARL